MVIEGEGVGHASLLHDGHAGAVGEREIFVDILHKDVPGSMTHLRVYLDHDYQVTLQYPTSKPNCLSMPCSEA
jgi:hypothetical protein